LVPHLATDNAVQKLLADLPANRMRVLPPTSPASQALPFMSPDMRYAVCRFDVAGGPVTISAQLPDKGWSLALYTRPAVERAALGFLHLGRAAADARASEIAVPQAEGLVVVRASLRGQAYANEVEAQLSRANCGLRRPEAERPARAGTAP
jgi:uncharacterized membrane protein